MAVRINTDDCIACGICEGTCPMGAILVGDIVQVEESLCVDCGACIAACPMGCIEDE